MVVGVDFDNTIVNYDRLMHQVAVENRWISPEVKKRKWDVREHMRERFGSDHEWVELQGIVYGERIQEAEIIDGVRKFFQSCKQRGCKTFVVSHKTPYANSGKSDINLKQAAMCWMTKNRVLEPGLGLSAEDIYFEPTRAAKLHRIRNLGCTHFIDDLEETFLEESYPVETAKILYAPDNAHYDMPDLTVARSWEEIANHVFDT